MAGAVLVFCLFPLFPDLHLTQEADVPLEAARLDAFIKSAGASELGRSVRWTVAAKVLSTPKTVRRGYELHVHKGIGILVPTASTALEEVKRRGGRAVLRGRIVRVPESGRGKGDPEYALEVREISRRK